MTNRYPTSVAPLNAAIAMIERLRDEALTLEKHMRAAYGLDPLYSYLDAIEVMFEELAEEDYSPESLDALRTFLMTLPD